MLLSANSVVPHTSKSGDILEVVRLSLPQGDGHGRVKVVGGVFEGFCG